MCLMRINPRHSLSSGTIRLTRNEPGRTTPCTTRRSFRLWLTSSIVVEIGGILSHAAVTAREYGIPAVSLPGAMKLIEDGSIITVNGGTGEVQLAQDSAKAEEIQS